MQWLLHGNLTPAAAEALKRHGHTTHLQSEMDLPPEATHGDILAAAARRQWDILTSEHEFSIAPFAHDKRFTRSIVFLQLPGGDVEQDDAIDRLFKRYKRLAPGRLYTVTENRVKIRQLPTRPMKDLT